MPLHPVAKQLLEDAAASDQPNCHLLPIAQARANFEATFGALPVDELARVEDLVATTPAGDIPVRLYTPTTIGVLPLVVYLHGGGWQMGSINSHDGICRAIANETAAAVLSVGYRQPPEHKFPAAPNDCYAALAWAVQNAESLGIDGQRVAIAGDSAGGNLAAAVALQARDNDGPAIACQALIYPATTFDLAVGFDIGFEGYVLFRDEVQWHKNAYFINEDDAAAPGASPLNGDLAGLPPTLVITAEFDPLHSAGEAFAKKLEEAGVKTDFRQYDGMIHGFVQFPTLFDDASEAVEHVGDFIKVHLAGGAQ